MSNATRQKQANNSADSFLGSLFTQCVAAAICPAFAMTIQAGEMADDLYTDRATSKFELNTPKALGGIFDMGANANTNAAPKPMYSDVYKMHAPKPSRFGFSMAA